MAPGLSSPALLSFPQGEVIQRDGNTSVLCPQAELGRAQGLVLSLHNCKPLVDLVQGHQWPQLSPRNGEGRKEGEKERRKCQKNGKR